MAPLKYQLTIYQGATFRAPFRWSAGDPPAPVDLTGCTAKMQVREKLESPDVLLELTTENGGIALGADGSVTLFLSDTTTAAIQWRAGVYDLEIKFTDGDVRRLLFGAVKVVPEVTRG